MARFLPGFLIALAVFALPYGAAAQVIESTFISYGSWSHAPNWAPAEVPNNTGSKSFNVTIPYNYVALTGAATISNLTVEGDYTALTIEGALTVLDTTTNTAWLGLDDEDSRGIELRARKERRAGDGSGRSLRSGSLKADCWSAQSKHSAPGV